MRVDTMFGVPVYVLAEDMELPQEGNYYVVASNGIFLHKNTGLMQASFPVEGISPLMEYKATNAIRHSLEKIDQDLCYKVKTFFARVVAEHCSESCVILYYNPHVTQNKYALVVPQQAVSHGGVRYRRKGLTFSEELAGTGYLPIGTIHSHCDFQAFHSGTDHGDEISWDGLHITFGHNDKDEFTISASMMMNGRRAKIDPESVLEGITLVKDDVYTLHEQSEPFVKCVSEEIDSWMTQILPWKELEQLLIEDAASDN